MIKDRPGEAEAAAVVREFAGVELGDLRLEKRAIAIAPKLVSQPDASFPKALGTAADLEAYYRFLGNPDVTATGLLEPHVRATVARGSAYSEALAVHDTTEFRFGGTRSDLGQLTQSGHGFLAHFAIAVTLDDRRDPLGTVALETWTRTGPTASALRKQKKLSSAEALIVPNEQDRWWRAIEAAEAEVAGATSLIHVMDSEADDYDLMSKLVEGCRRWVIRLCYDRVLAIAGEPRKTKQFVAQRAVLCERTVYLSRRHRQPGGAKRKRTAPRPERVATLAISSSPVIFRRPSNYKTGVETLPVNVVSVREIDPPSDAQAVEWHLITTEPIESEEQVLKVIDCYRGRWRIEEFFKCLKTGCAFEKRQLESRQTLLNALALFIPVAWILLRLRTAARCDQSIPASAILDAEQTLVLRKASQVTFRLTLPETLTARAAMLAIARFGGHLRSNGDPGWMVLGRGYQDLLMMVVGYRLATARCDQS
jgi:Transposase DNA-binding/Transposase DDE domain